MRPLRRRLPLRALSGLLCLLPTVAAAVDEDEVRAAAFVEWELPDTCFVHQPVRCVLRFGIEGEFLAERAIQPFRQALDVPVQVQAAWPLEGAEIDEVLAPAAGLAAEASFVLSGRPARCAVAPAETRDGVSFEVFELEGTVVADRAGELLFEAPLVELAYATRFREDFVHGRVPEDRIDVSVAGDQRVLMVRDLPEEGRPYAFAGAVGRLELSASTDVRAARLRESFVVLLRASGPGAAGLSGPPELRLEGFRVQGVVERARTDEADRARTFAYDLWATDPAVTALPAIEVPYFDPERGTYDTTRTEALPLEIVPGERRGRVEPDEPVRGPAPPREDTERSSTGGAALPTWAIGLLGLIGLALILGLVYRRTVSHKR